MKMIMISDRRTELLGSLVLPLGRILHMATSGIIDDAGDNDEVDEGDEVMKVMRMIMAMIMMMMFQVR